MKTLTEWARILGLSRAMLYQRARYRRVPPDAIAGRVWLFSHETIESLIMKRGRA